MLILCAQGHERHLLQVLSGKIFLTEEAEANHQTCDNCVVSHF